MEEIVEEINKLSLVLDYNEMQNQSNTKGRILEELRLFPSYKTT